MKNILTIKAFDVNDETIRLPKEGCYCSLRERVNDAEDIELLLAKVMIIADTLRSDNFNTLTL